MGYVYSGVVTPVHAGLCVKIRRNLTQRCVEDEMCWKYRAGGGGASTKEGPKFHENFASYKDCSEEGAVFRSPRI